MHYESESEIRKAIEKQLQGELSDKVWNEYRPDWSPPYDEDDLEEIVAELSLAGISFSKEDKEVPNAAIIRIVSGRKRCYPGLRTIENHSSVIQSLHLRIFQRWKNG